MITEEDRAKVGEIAMRAIDAIVDRFGDDAVLEDAVMLVEVSYPYDERDGERLSEVIARTTTHRATVAGGIAAAYARTQLEGFVQDD